MGRHGAYFSRALFDVLPLRARSSRVDGCSSEWGEVERDLQAQGDSINVPKNTRKLAFYVYMKAPNGICTQFWLWGAVPDTP